MQSTCMLLPFNNAPMILLIESLETQNLIPSKTPTSRKSITLDTRNNPSSGTKHIKIPPHMRRSLHLPSPLPHNRQEFSRSQNLSHQTKRETNHALDDDVMGWFGWIEVEICFVDGGGCEDGSVVEA
jgi:hypothetical protein